MDGFGGGVLKLAGLSEGALFTDVGSIGAFPTFVWAFPNGGLGSRANDAFGFPGCGGVLDGTSKMAGSTVLNFFAAVKAFLELGVPLIRSAFLSVSIERNELVDQYVLLSMPRHKRIFGN